jgi:hypothetical protein
VYSIEYYLLESLAICETFNCNDEHIISEIQQSIDDKMDDIHNKSILPKNFLKELCEKYFHSYDETSTAIRVAEHVSVSHLKRFPQILNLVSLITR